jgi:hypothetical protein
MKTENKRQRAENRSRKSAAANAELPLRQPLTHASSSVSAAPIPYLESL